MLVFPVAAATRRSSPMPVSMFFFGSGLRLPSDCRSNWVNTRFHISRYRSQLHPGAQSGFPQLSDGPMSINISEHGPQGPVGPIFQKFESSPSLMILDSGTIFFQRLYASSSSLKIVG